MKNLVVKKINDVTNVNCLVLSFSCLVFNCSMKKFKKIIYNCTYLTKRKKETKHFKYPDTFSANPQQHSQYRFNLRIFMNIDRMMS